MAFIWTSRTKYKEKSDLEPSKATPGVGPGDIAVFVEDDDLHMEQVRLACRLAKRANRKVHLVHVIQVPRSVSLKAPLSESLTQQVDALLRKALKIAKEEECDAAAE